MDRGKVCCNTTCDQAPGRSAVAMPAAMDRAKDRLRDLQHSVKPTLHELQHSVRPGARKVKRSLCSMAFCVQAVKTVTLVLIYYVFSIGLTFYNQRVISHFRYPLSITMCHLVTKFLMAWGLRSIIECKAGKPRITLTWKVYFTRIAPTGLASIFDIGLSNWSFEFITVSLYTMSKSSAVIFILMFALIFKLEKWRWSLLLVVLFIAVGLFMFTYHATQFNGEGFAMVMAASFLSGLRWTLAQLVTQKQEIGLHHPLDLMYHIQPWMIIGLLPLSAAFEGMSIATTDQLFRYSDTDVVLRNLALVFAGAVIAFCLEFSEFLLLAQTSSLTLSISGIFKELCTLLLAALINHDMMNAVNGIGLVVCLSGIVLHVVLKAVNSKDEQDTYSHEAMEMLTRNGEANIDDEEDDEEIFNVRHDR